MKEGLDRGFRIAASAAALAVPAEQVLNHFDNGFYDAQSNTINLYQDGEQPNPLETETAPEIIPSVTPQPNTDGKPAYMYTNSDGELIPVRMQTYFAGGSNPDGTGIDRFENPDLGVYDTYSRVSGTESFLINAVYTGFNANNSILGPNPDNPTEDIEIPVVQFNFIVPVNGQDITFIGNMIVTENNPDPTFVVSQDNQQGGPRASTSTLQDILQEGMNIIATTFHPYTETQLRAIFNDANLPCDDWCTSQITFFNEISNDYDVIQNIANGDVVNLDSNKPINFMLASFTSRELQNMLPRN